MTVAPMDYRAKVTCRFPRTLGATHGYQPVTRPRVPGVHSLNSRSCMSMVIKKKLPDTCSEPLVMDSLPCTPDMSNRIEETIRRPDHGRLYSVMCSGGNNCVLRLLLHLMTYFVTCFMTRLLGFEPRTKQSQLNSRGGKCPGVRRKVFKTTIWRF
jgi:hypothetical protein